MTEADRELDDLLGESPADRPPPQLIPWGWRIFLVLLVCFDLVCLLIGRIPWSGGSRGLDRGDAVFSIVVGLGLGLIAAMLAELVAAGRAAQIGLTAEEAALAADELSILTRPRRPGRLSFVVLGAAVWVLCTLFAKFAFQHAWLPAAAIFVAAHAVVGLAVPVLVREFRRENQAFLAWMDEKNAPFNAEAAERAAARREQMAALIARVREAEDEIRARLDRMPRQPPPWYLVPQAMWALPVLAVGLDLVLLFAPGARAAAFGAEQAGIFRLIWGVISLGAQGFVLLGVVWAVLAWYYVPISDQVSRRWAGRDWSSGLSAIAVEVVFAALAVAVLASLLAGWAPRFVVGNLLAPSFILVGVLRDTRDTAQEHYQRSLRRRAAESGPPPEADEE